MTTGLVTKFRKVFRFISIYGIGKTFYKVLGRMRLPNRLLQRSGAHRRDIGVIGCGQFSFATIGYAINRKYGNRFIDCYDIDPNPHESFARFYRIENPAISPEGVIHNDQVKYVYIVSNHASHTDYALETLKAGKTAYIEKPISVNYDQFRALITAIRRSEVPVYAGYNRPFSGAIRVLRSYVQDGPKPLTLNCFVTGHFLGPDHWYRRPEEGTRICGNVGHWLDLAVHMLSWNGLPDRWTVTLTYTDPLARDDNMAISLASKNGDLVNIVLTARSEPFEGINETINFQYDDVIAKIDDFRRMTVWKGDKIKHYRFWPKDVGHNLALIQPFSSITREWGEVELSTLLMLFIKDMVDAGERFKEFSFSEEWERLATD